MRAEQAKPPARPFPWPNLVTAAGLALTIAGALFLAADLAGQPAATPGTRTLLTLLATLGIGTGFLLDAADGALARALRRPSPFGAALDSFSDRVGETAVFGACAVGFAASGWLTGVALATIALGGGLAVSYLRAQAGDTVKSIGFWRRPERCAALFLGVATVSMPPILWALALGAWLSALARFRAAYGPTPPRLGPPRPWDRRSRRYWLTTLILAALLLTDALTTGLLTPRHDPLRFLLTQ